MLYIGFLIRCYCIITFWNKIEIKEKLLCVWLSKIKKEVLYIKTDKGERKMIINSVKLKNFRKRDKFASESVESLEKYVIIN